MKLKILSLFSALIYSAVVFSQIGNGGYGDSGTSVDAPGNSPFQVSGDIIGNIQNSINNTTGKIAFSVPLSQVMSGTASYNVNLFYNGQTSFKMARETNEYNPTGILGVGWGMLIPKIVTDNKNTASRDDDVFYLQDGATNTKLICYQRGNTTNGSVWKFKTEIYTNWIIEFYYSNSQTDYWKITKDDGLIYFYGGETSDVEKSREYILRFGNWIGNSKHTGTRQTVIWNLSKIKDQANNFITLEYIQDTQKGQTEACYLRTIRSSKGGNIWFNYGSKIIFGDYEEPQQEKGEPDAYQERYEKKFLQSVTVYNNDNLLRKTYDLEYLLEGNNLSKKRYLKKITETSHKNNESESLPPQEFEYHLSGDFEGGLYKVTYPMGGVVTYNYSNKLLFNNSPNRYKNSPIYNTLTNFNFYSAYVGDDYSLFIMISKNPESGDRYRYKMIRYWWNGKEWEEDLYTFPDLMNDDMQDFYSVFENDFYGFLFNINNTGKIYLFHKEKNDNSWNFYSDTSGNTFMPDSKFLSGNEFIAAASHNGPLRTYVWNGSAWQKTLISQPVGEYYYGATNNFILSLNEDGGNDMTYPNTFYNDNFYIHYLDAEKNWQIKSWSSYMNANINSTELPSYFFPDNALTGLIIDDNPELFLRWDMNYNITNIDDKVGSFVDGQNQFQPIRSSFFTLFNTFYTMPKISARFNGLDWTTHTLPNSSAYYAKLNFGEDFYTFQNHDMYNYGVGYHLYDPNHDTWEYNILNNYSWDQSNEKLVSINPKFIISGNLIFRRSKGPLSQTRFFQIGGLQYNNEFTQSDGVSHSFVEQYDNNLLKKGTYYYINKENGALAYTDVGLRYHLKGHRKLGGSSPFLSRQSMWLRQDINTTTFNPYLYRIIDDKIMQNIYSIVVDNIEIDNNEANIRKIQYNYSNAKPLMNNDETYFGEVTIENKGRGTGNVGMIKQIYDTGLTDSQRLGLLLEEHILDSNGNFVKKTSTIWEKFNVNIFNGTYNIDISYYFRPVIQKFQNFYGTESILTEIDNEYNLKGQLSRTSKMNSQGLTESKEIQYATQSFMRDKNIINEPFEVINKINGEITSIERTVWELNPNSPNMVFPKEKWVKINNSDFKLINRNRKISNFGNVVETEGSESYIYNTVLYGYNGMHPVASVSNQSYDSVISALDVSYSGLQALMGQQLKSELLKIYDRRPDGMITVKIYDEDGRVITEIDNRKNETNYFYDIHGRLDYIKDGDGNILTKKEYKVIQN